MRFALTSLAAVAAAVATPAMAGEGRLEARSGINWVSGGGAALASVGVAGGYDWDLGGGAFGGLEASGDKVLANGAQVFFAASARLGMKVSEPGKLYALGGYGTTFDKNEDDWNLGAGYQHDLGKLYVKVEYRRQLDSKINTVLTGIGTKF